MTLRIRSLLLLLLLPAQALAAENSKALLKQKLDAIIIPHVLFREATLDQALDYLRTQSRELDPFPTPAGNKGVKIILRAGDRSDTPSITLDVKDLPLSEALRYVCELTQYKFRIEEQSVLIVPLAEEFETEKHTRTFKVPPDFLTSCGLAGGSPISSPDPFAQSVPAPSSPFPALTARKVLEAAGVHFSAGTSASYNCITGILTVTNTLPNLDLVEACVDSMRRATPTNIAFTLTVIEGPGELIRQAGTAASDSPHTFKQLTALLDHAAKPDSGVHVVSDAFVEAGSGKATFETVHEHPPPSPLVLTAKGSNATPAPPAEKTGLQLEIDPAIIDGSSTIKASLSLTLTAPPSPTTDIPGLQLRTDLLIHDGETKLIGITGPLSTSQDHADVLCAVFLSATLRHVEVLPLPQPKTAAPSSLPPGMIFAVLPAPEACFDELLSSSPSRTLQASLTNCGVTFDPGSSVEHRGGQLLLVNTPDNISSIANILDQLVISGGIHKIACTLHTLEAPAPFLRDLARQTLASADDSATFAALESAVARGTASFIDSSFLLLNSNNFATRHAAREHAFIEDRGTDANGRHDLYREPRLAGSTFDVNAVIGDAGRTVDVTYTHELHPAAMQQPATGLHFHRTSNYVSLSDGSTRLISLTTPPAPARSGMLWATFLKCDLVRTFAKPSKPSPKSPVPQAAEKMQVRHFGSKSPPSEGGLVPAHTRPVTNEAIQEYLESIGVSFPSGAYVRKLDFYRGILVRNTPHNLTLIQAIFDQAALDPTMPGEEHPSRTAIFTAHVFQAPGQLLRQLTAQAARKSDHRAELDTLLAAVKTGTAKALATARIESIPGKRSIVQQGITHPTLTAAYITREGAPEILTENRNIGFKFELTSHINAGRNLAELSLLPEFHTAPFFVHPEQAIAPQGRRLEFPLTDFFTSKVTTHIAIHGGTALLISLDKPAGNPDLAKQDLLQVLFITCDIPRPAE